jgi:hypothetical protein
MTPLPHYENDALAAMSASELIKLLIHDEDRPPRMLIDECARRGETMVEHLREVLAQGHAWDIENDKEDEGEDEIAIENIDGEWWLIHHAVMILGLIPSENAGLLLTDYMRRIDEELDEDLQDWLEGRWPALFFNKPESVLPALRALCDDDALEWYTRHDALDCLIALAQRNGETALEAALDRAAQLAGNESEDWDLRMVTGNTVLNFAPAQHRRLLETLAAEQSGMGTVFNAADVRKTYAAGGGEKEWEQFADPWAFYAPDAIEERQQHWAKIDAAEPETFVRAGPKIGRNDPCPCGSGKKYKKCCLQT